MRQLPILLAVLLCFFVTARAAEEERTFIVETWFIVVPDAKALELQEKLLDVGTEEKVCDELLALAMKGGAKLEAHLRVKAVDRQRGVAEAVEEKRYAVEFEQPALPATKEQAESFKDEWMVIKPVTFETRNVGKMMEAEVETTGEFLRATCAVSHVRFLGMEKWECFKLKSGFVGSIEQPKFHSLRTNSTFPVRSGEKVLLASNRVPEPENHWEFWILRVTEEPKPAGEGKK